ncbi:MAG: hypothetical protein A2Y33_14245 [Spirochaetes bacterium GWF1_51_8]|nr:MAG: hypothetical protein A2Y33_14245 [Spirochaetes bacterium GWF1_51_8]
MTDYHEISELLPMKPEELIIVEKKYRSAKRFRLFFILFQIIWIGMIVTGIVNKFYPVAVFGGLLSAAYFICTIYYNRRLKLFSEDLDERNVEVIKGTVGEKRIKPGRVFRFFTISINGKKYDLPRRLYTQVIAGTEVTIPVARHSRIVLLRENL